MSSRKIYRAFFIIFLCYPLLVYLIPCCSFRQVALARPWAKPKVRLLKYPGCSCPATEKVRQLALLISEELLISLRDRPCLEFGIVSSNFQAQDKLLESV